MTGPEAPPRADGFVLDLPADAAFVASARVFAAGVARRAGCDETQVDDVKLAVSEAWAAIAGAGPSGSVRLEIAPEGDRLRFELRSAGPRSAAEPPDRPWPGGIELVRALFEDAEVLDEGPARTARFSVPLRPSA
ncbi:MAG TPA: ATP-binding protein [Actinomycetota bacterium]|nr:ATP-binding protein [Actinomycetota bacterium]